MNTREDRLREAVARALYNLRWRQQGADASRAVDWFAVPPVDRQPFYQQATTALAAVKVFERDEKKRTRRPRRRR